MISRSNMPSLLRGDKKMPGKTKRSSDGMRVKDQTLVKDFQQKSGSLTHKSLVREPSLRALGARKKDIEDGLPHPVRKNLTKRNDSVATNAKLVKTRRDPAVFMDPHEFGPNASKSAPKRDRFKSGGRTSSSKAQDVMWIEAAIKKPGALRRSIGVKSGEKIPLSKLEKAEHSKSPLTRRRAKLASTLRGFDHS